MAASENTVYTALRPVQILTKVFGFCTNKRSAGEENQLSSLGVIHVVLILLLKAFLIYYNLDPSKFDKATNSKILNSGLWIQTEATLVISVMYIVLGSRKSNDMWKILQEFNSIDQEFSKLFFIKYHYVQAKHWITLLVMTGIVAHFVLTLITAYYLWNLPLEYWHKLSILVAIYISNMCIYAIANQFICALLYLSSRFQNINDILTQLMFDEPIDADVLIIENERSVDHVVFIESTPSYKQSKPQNHFDVRFIDTNDNNGSIRVHYPFDKEFPRAITNGSEAKSESARFEKRNVMSFSQAVLKTCITKLAFTRSSSIEDITNKLDKLMELHDRLCDCVEMGNNLLALQVFLISLTICVYIVFGLFAKYRVWMEYQYEAESVARMNIYWIFVYGLFVTKGTYISTRLMRKVKETAIVIHKIACRNENHVLLSKLSQISQMLHSRKTTVGCGLIPFDWPTLFSLFGSVCMYLIILMQFYISGKSSRILQQSQTNDTSAA